LETIRYGFSGEWDAACGGPLSGEKDGYCPRGGVSQAGGGGSRQTEGAKKSNGVVGPLLLGREAGWCKEKGATGCG